MEGERENSPPFWPQPQRRPSPSSSSGLRPWVLVLLSSIFIILFLPAFLSSSSSSSSRGLRPGSLIKNGWDTLNLCLVLFAILCGLLGRSNGDEADKSLRSAEWPEVGYSAPPSVQTGYGDTAVTPTAGIRRMRSSSSYPDLRLEAVDAWGGAAEAWRFSDDIQLYHRARRSEVEAKTNPLGAGEGWRFSDDVQLQHRGRRSENNHREWERTPEGESKTIPVDTFVLRKSPPRSRSPPPTPSPPPPPPPPPPQSHSRGRSVHELPEKEEEQEAKMEEEKTQPHSPAPPPPPPPPPSPLPTQEQKRSQKKKSAGGAKDIATAISLFYNKKRKKGSKTKKVHDDTSPPANAPASPQTPPAPPPPPPPPSSVFYQLFSSRKVGSKSWKIHSTLPYPSPPPPPQPATLKRRSKRHASFPPPPPAPPPTDKSTKEVSLSPPAPQRENLYDKREKTNQSRFSLPPSSPLLPPPPPPPPPSDLQLLLSEEEILVDGVLGGGGGMAGGEREGKEGVAVFCPSPDVNNKADLFIARFRAGLKLEKLNSLREKQRRHQEEEQQQEEEFMMERGVFDNDSTPS